MRLFLASALLAAAPLAGLAAPAIAAPLQHFQQDGETYSYSASRQADGAVLLRGTVDSSGEAFNLRVRGTSVNGRIGMSPVAFQVSPATAARVAEEVPAAATTLAAN